jgi:glycosyltransferase involved in cell wall biosynthesis
MKICLVAHFTHDQLSGDLGTKNVARHLAKELSKRHEILQLDVRAVSRWHELKAFKPEIIHFVLGPTTRGLMVAKAFKNWQNDARVIVSAPNPHVWLRLLLPLLKPDLILAQSAEYEGLFKEYGFRTAFLPNGVDIHHFIPVTQEEKRVIRTKYGIDVSKFLILHVGPIIQPRNVSTLVNLQDEGTQVLIIGRNPFDRDVYQSLVNKGCTVWIKHFENIAEIYQMSDCYVFPTSPKNTTASIDIPLSVLEAMACNIPVITTRYGAIPRMFEHEGDGLFFVDNNEYLLRTVDTVRNGDFKIKTCKKVLPYSWENIGQRLEEIYEGLKRRSD